MDSRANQAFQQHVFFTIIFMSKGKSEIYVSSTYQQYLKLEDKAASA
jgi:hypothetical protein